jgi:hypothetical protein
MTSDRRVALVSIADDNRGAIAAYLRSSGFDVHECDDLPVPSSFGALVWLAGGTAGDDVVASVRSWLRLAKRQRIVVVTSQPAALRDVAGAHAERLLVLAAPVFGWELVDALRATPAPRPRGA